MQLIPGVYDNSLDTASGSSKRAVTKTSTITAAAISSPNTHLSTWRTAQCRRAVARGLAEWLTTLGGINPCKPNGTLHKVGVEYFDRVPIGDASDIAAQLGANGREWEE